MENYQVLDTIGRGSFGTVTRVKNRQDGKIYACKDISYGRMSEKEKELLVSEVNLLREMDHEYIVKYKDRILDKNRQRIYIYMEYCSGGDLASYIKRHKSQRNYVSENTVWAVFIQMLKALHYCHTHRPKMILHRDIKPGNIMMTSTSAVKLGDFGLARTLGDYSLARTNVGTPLYMSPEQIQKRPYNDKCDIWALGCLLFELASLVPPFEATSVAGLNLKIKAGKFNPLPAQYSAELSGIVRSMLSHDPKSRPSTTDLVKLPTVAQRMRNAVLRGKAPMDHAAQNRERARPRVREPAPAQLAPRAPTKPQSRPTSAVAVDPAKERERLNALATQLRRREADVERREYEVKRREDALRRKEDELNMRERRERMRAM
ncbi:hypothetical protein KIPB_000966 [Kipferlia bialata]|uniref:non-specific serine/threonine protein kinase n=1 Tax=Kipferlia bialata TaxID=797122 RepID=A0A9K3CN79_9EUKA|nr:hypothetical protein KIPB_000966 [Kipferlia bialata]|eukprot:g966.t1